MYRETIVLLCFSALQEAGSTLTLSYMEIDYDGSAQPLLAWVYGSLIGVALVALFSDLVFRSDLLFLPVSFFVTLQVCIQIGLLLTDILIDDFSRDSKYLLFTEGFVESCMQFYIFFLIPIRIATKYRATQEVTPAATIVATSIALTYMTAKSIRLTIIASLHSWGTLPLVEEILPLTLHLMAMGFVLKFLCDEWREQRRRQSIFES